MSRAVPRRLVVAGVALAVVGSITAIVFAVAQAACNGANQRADLVGLTRESCTAQTTGAGVGVGVLVVGALLLVAGALATTPRFTRPDEEERDDGPDASPGEETGPPDRLF
ncbi:MAG TPA: hypothetical protein VK277_03885 [Acidimicrobiales bacterium]|nr:hypothetical protein [Acidimicrobiales bacterium]